MSDVTLIGGIWSMPSRKPLSLSASGFSKSRRCPSNSALSTSERIGRVTSRFHQILTPS